jgi:hypothetical protein
MGSMFELSSAPEFMRTMGASGDPNNPNIYKGPNGQTLLKAQGGWYIGPGGEQIWDPAAYFKKQEEKNQTMSEFMASNSGKSMATPFDPAVNQYKRQVDSYLAAPRPVMDTSNRFEAGLSANERRLNSLLEDPEAVRQTAAYKFRLKQGEDAIQRNLGAKGLLNSGNRLMELTKYGQDMGSQEYDVQANRLRDLVGMYSGNWIGDKNANTAKYSAESNAWNQRGGILSDFYKTSGALANDRAGVQSRDSLGWASVYQNNRPDKHYVTGGQAPMQVSPFSPIGGNTPYQAPIDESPKADPLKGTRYAGSTGGYAYYY